MFFCSFKVLEFQVNLLIDFLIFHAWSIDSISVFNIVPFFGHQSKVAIVRTLTLKLWWSIECHLSLILVMGHPSNSCKGTSINDRQFSVKYLPNVGILKLEVNYVSTYIELACYNTTKLNVLLSTFLEKGTYKNGDIRHHLWIAPKLKFCQCLFASHLYRHSPIHFLELYNVQLAYLIGKE